VSGSVVEVTTVGTVGEDNCTSRGIVAVEAAREVVAAVEASTVASTVK